MALNAQIKIEKGQALKWHRRAFRWSALFKFAQYYAMEAIGLWLIIAIADLIGGQPQLATLHAFVLFLIWIIITIYAYYAWYNDLEKSTVGWEFDAALDEDGVKTDAKVETERQVPWSFYAGYREFDDHLEIHDKNEEITFVPKTDELADVVAFTKEKVRPL